jgi:hypothetical protein
MISSQPFIFVAARSSPQRNSSVHPGITESQREKKSLEISILCGRPPAFRNFRMKKGLNLRLRTRDLSRCGKPV